MPDRLWIVDASVLGAAFFEEADTEAARAFVLDSPALAAPSLLALEVASIAAKKIWKGLCQSAVGERAVLETGRLVTLIETLGPLAPAAFALARDHRFSAYDATYLALAMERSTRVVTLDAKLSSRARDHGLGEWVIHLADLPGV